jgi:hypothetical protein
MNKKYYITKVGLKNKKYGSKIQTLNPTIRYRANVKIKDSVLYVNYWNQGTKSSHIDSIQLKNRKPLRLTFSETTISGLTIPLKYRLPDKSSRLEEDFSAGFNANLFIGYSVGYTSFTYREKIDNRITNYKFTFGGFVGASTIELNAQNTSLSLTPLGENEKFNKGLATIGLGFTFSSDKFNIGTFLGKDFSVGQKASKWNYNNKPWIGIGVGLGIFGT